LYAISVQDEAVEKSHEEWSTERGDCDVDKQSEFVHIPREACHDIDAANPVESTA